jgi:enamine deaminase RidA (YjgF/YER057c/UK114 family)
MSKRFLNLGGKRPPGYTHVVVSPPGMMVFVSGQGGAAPDGVLPADFPAQARNTFENLKRCLELAGAGFKDVVKINYYVSDIANLAILRSLRAEYLDMDNPPASTLVECGLVEGLLVEIEAVAVIPSPEAQGQ